MLVGKGMGRKRAYQIMEIVRKGRAGTIFEKSGIEDTVASYLTETQIQILNKIEYLFPKAHAVTYTILAAKAAWYKLHYPMELYQAYLDVSSLPENFLKDVSKGRKSLGFGCAEEQPYHAIYEVVCEMTLRGYHISNDTDGRIVIKE
jgi:DNA polymerase-3 subunit alpha (Gram-positive type)